MKATALGKCQARLGSRLEGGSDQNSGHESHTLVSCPELAPIPVSLAPSQGPWGSPQTKGQWGGRPPPQLHTLRSHCFLCMVSSGSQGPWPSLSTAGHAILSGNSVACCRPLASTPTLIPTELSPALPIPQASPWLGVPPEDGVPVVTSRMRYPVCWPSTWLWTKSMPGLGLAWPCSQRAQGMVGRQPP